MNKTYLHGPLVDRTVQYKGHVTSKIRLARAGAALLGHHIGRRRLDAASQSRGSVGTCAKEPVQSRQRTRRNTVQGRSCPENRRGGIRQCDIPSPVMELKARDGQKKNKCHHTFGTGNRSRTHHRCCLERCFDRKIQSRQTLVVCQRGDRFMAFPALVVFF
jgi:hypothetical protein